MNIPLMDLYQSNEAILADSLRDIEELVKHSRFIGGETLTRFEGEFATFAGAKYGAGISNGTSSLELSLKAMQIGPQDEVITVSHTFAATVEAILAVGAKPVLVDVRPESGVMDVSLIEEKITSRTRAVIPVHIYGFVVDMDRLSSLARKHRLAILQDAAQAHGALWNGKKLGTFPGLQSYSFYPGKNLGAWGDAGAVTGNDADLLQVIRALRNHGRKENEKYMHHYLGVNDRMDPIQALVLSKKLVGLEGKNKRRRELYKVFAQELGGVGDLKILAGDNNCTPVHHLLVVTTKERDRLAQHCSRHGVATGIHYPQPLHCQPVFQSVCEFSSLPHTDELAQTILSLPFFPEMTPQQTEAVIRTVKSFFT